MKNKTKITIGSLLLVIALLSSVLAALIVTRTVNNVGTIKSLGDFKIYWDQQCTNEMTQIDWSNVIAGSWNECPAWIKHIGSIDSTTLYINYSVAYTDSRVELYMRWNGEDWQGKKALNPNDVVPIKFVLHVKDDAFGGPFSYLVTFNGYDSP